MSKLEMILKCFSESTTEIQVLPANKNNLCSLNDYINYNENSSFGIVLSHTGGVVIDSWIRIYGCGDIDFVQRNKLLKEYGVMIIAEDIVGGLFGLEKSGQMVYFAPDTLKWEAMEIDYQSFLSWVCEKEKVDLFYDTFRFENWEETAKSLTFEQGIAHFPFLWTSDNGVDRHREIIPIEEVLMLQLDLSKTINAPNQ